MITSIDTLGLSAELAALASTFTPYAWERRREVMGGELKFVHYTSAQTALSILRKKEMWMRNAKVMNDFSEIEHGRACLSKAYNTNKRAMESLFDQMFPGFCSKLERALDGWLPHFETETYLACLSEHCPSENAHGRLSMWRAYGMPSGVAVILNAGPFLRPSTAFKAYTSPVAYVDANGFCKEFGRLLQSITSKLDYVQSLGEDLVFAHIFGAFRFAIMSTKHPGFREEREWRVIYSPNFESSRVIYSTVESVGGIPQQIYKIPLEDVPEEGLVGLATEEFVDRIIIGPSSHPLQIQKAFISVLRESGLSDAENRVVVSDIPLRT